MTQVRDIVIIGAGIAGSSLAKAMADRGWDTVLLDRQRFPRHKVCGEFLSPESYGVLDDFRLCEQVESLVPARIDSCKLVMSEGTELDIPLPGSGLGVSRYALDEMLHGAARSSGVEIRKETSVQLIDPTCDGGYSIVTRQRGLVETMHARTVVAAWGTSPRMGQEIVQPRKPSRIWGREPDYVGVKSHYAGINVGRATELYFLRSGYLGISPVEGGHVNVCALLRQSELPDNLKDKSVLGLLKEAARLQPQLREKLAAAVPVAGTQAAVAPVRLSREPLPWGACAHVGDAAVMVPPLCGDGMTMALRSAQLCARYADGFLRGELTAQDWRRLYTEAIVQEFSAPLRWGRFLHRLSEQPVLPGLLMKLARLSPQLATSLMHATRLKEIGR